MTDVLDRTKHPKCSSLDHAPESPVLKPNDNRLKTRLLTAYLADLPLKLETTSHDFHANHKSGRVWAGSVVFVSCQIWSAPLSPEASTLIFLIPLPRSMIQRTEATMRLGSQTFSARRSKLAGRHIWVSTTEMPFKLQFTV